VTELLKAKQYEPYRDIPYTAEEDPVADTPRNRLLAFIGKFSDAYSEHAMHGGSPVPPKDVLANGSLVKWESSIDEGVLGIARGLLLAANGGKAPAVLDPFAGGGAIPLEAARLGCESYANELNPVAHLVERCALEFPQTYGKTATFSSEKYVRLYGADKDDGLGGEIQVKNRLAHDVEYWATWVLERVRAEIGHLYPTREDGKTPVAYYWVRTVPCSNPSCRATVPLLRSYWLCRKAKKKVALRLLVDIAAKRVSYEIVEGKNIDFDPAVALNSRGNVRCPVCAEVTPVKDVRAAAMRGDMGEDLVAVIEDGAHGKRYRLADEEDRRAFEVAKGIDVERPSEAIEENQWNIKTWLYGMNTWGSLFNPRQLVAVQTFVKHLRMAREEMVTRGWDEVYAKVVTAYLGLWVDRIAIVTTSVSRWNTVGEKIEHPFARQAIAMMWDYPEANPFSGVTGSAANHLGWITGYIGRNAQAYPATCHLGSAAKIDHITAASLHAVVTDPPYYDAISYADLSDFFYVWLKRTVGDAFPEVFRTPLTPKGEECTSLKHRFDSENDARAHFETLLTASFAEAKRLITDHGVVTIMFAHQSTEAWTAFVKAILDAGLTITASWPIDTEMKNKVGAVGSTNASYLASSVTVVCRKRQTGAAAAFEDIKNELEETIASSLDRVWKLGFRGADLIVSTFGPAVGVFGTYERVEKADGSEVTVPELLELVRDIAFRQIVQELPSDDLTRAYVAWLNLYSTGTAPYDRAQKTIQMGTKTDIGDVIEKHHLFIRDGSDVRIALAADRSGMPKLGEGKHAPQIDRVHRAMLYWKKEERGGLVSFLTATGSHADDTFWRVLQALREVLPVGSDDAKSVQAILSERESLTTAAKQQQASTPSLFS
jgi:adenine-specific DNA methylase